MRKIVYAAKHGGCIAEGQKKPLRSGRIGAKIIRDNSSVARFSADIGNRQVSGC